MKQDIMFWLFIIIAAVFLTMITSVYIVALNRNRYDVNNDGIVNSEDLLELRKYLLEIED